MGIEGEREMGIEGERDGDRGRGVEDKGRERGMGIEGEREGWG